MVKNIALFIDGTWNHPGGESETNVRRLYVDAQDNASADQVCHYLSGVGTLGAEELGSADALRRRARLRAGLRYLPRWTRNLLGRAFGWGTAFKIKEAYAFLCEHYEQGDHVLLFGFSRGAFAARSLAGFAEEVGVLYRDKLELVEAAYSMYESPSEELRRQLRDSVRQMTGGVSPPFVEGPFALPIFFIGVWDTVAALGIPRRQAQQPAYFTEYHHTELPANVTHARHALALHELRSKFEPLLWIGHRPWQALQQVWFPGAHADIGGGYEERYLSDGALRWMACEAQKAGLKLSECPQLAGSPLGPDRVHHQLRGPFVANRATMRRCLREQEYLVPHEEHHVHRSVLERLRDPVSGRYRYWRPGVNAVLRKVDRAATQMTVLLRLHGRAIVT